MNDGCISGTTPKGIFEANKLMRLLVIIVWYGSDLDRFMR